MSRLLSYLYPSSYLLAASSSWTQYGLNSESYLRLAGMDVAKLQDPNATFTGEDIKQLHRIGRDLNITGRPDSVLVAEQLSFTNIGLLGLGVVATRNLQEAFDLVYEFYPLSMPGLVLDYQTDGDYFVINYQFDSEFDDALPFLNEVLVCVMKRFTDLFNGNVLAESVHFSHQPAYPLEMYSQFLGYRVYARPDADSGFCQIRFSQKSLEVGLKYPDANTLAMIRQQLHAALEAKENQGSWVTKVEKAWQHYAEKNHYLSQTDIAGQLNVSVRTLVRRLADEGSSYREITQKWRLEKAKRLLKRSHLPISLIAEKIGFEDESAFFRFFKEAEGITPKQYRCAE